MRKTLPLGTLMTLFTISCTTAPELQVVARVNGEKIRVGELQAELAREKALYDPDLLSREEAQTTLKKQVLDSLIHESLLLQEAAREGVRLNQEERGRAWEKLEGGYSNEELRKNLEEQGLTLREWRRRNERRFLIEKLLDGILSQSKPSEAEMQGEYRKNRSRYQIPELSHCRHIVSNSKEKAERILSLLKKGENFAQLAKEYSESPDREREGDLGWVAPGELPPIMDEACLKRLATGETSDVVASSYGFHIFRVIERRPAHSMSLAEARPLIEKTWREEHRQEILDRWLTEKKKDAKIEIDEAALIQTSFPL